MVGPKARAQPRPQRGRNPPPRSQTQNPLTLLPSLLLLASSLWLASAHFSAGSEKPSFQREEPSPRRVLPELHPDWPPGSQYWHWFREAAKKAAARQASGEGNDSNFGAASVPMPDFDPTYHNGAVLSRTPITVYLIWYGTWQEADKQAIRGFVQALQAATAPTARPNYGRSFSAKAAAKSAAKGAARGAAIGVVAKRRNTAPARKLASDWQPQQAQQQEQQQQQHSLPSVSSLPGSSQGGLLRQRQVLKGKKKKTDKDTETDNDGGRGKAVTGPPDPSAPGEGAPKPKVFTMRQWWTTTRQYTAKYRKRVSQYVVLQQEHAFPAASLSQGRNLTRFTTQFLVRAAMKSFGGSLPQDPHGLYVVLSAPEIRQQYFCSSSCAYHGFTASGLLQTPPKPLDSLPMEYKPWRGPQVAMAWVGNPSTQCPGYCGFPYIAPAYVPASFARPVKPPSGRVSIDSMVSVLAHEILESSTNPFGGGWFTGSPDWPGEVADLCLGSYGPGSFPGFPGYLATTKAGGAYNVVGLKGEKYLLPMYWSNTAEGCVAGTV